MSLQSAILYQRQFLPAGSWERKHQRFEEGNLQHTEQETSWDEWTPAQFIAAILEEGDDQWNYLMELCRRLDEFPLTTYRRRKIREIVQVIAAGLRVNELWIDKLLKQIQEAEKKS